MGSRNFTSNSLLKIKMSPHLLGTLPHIFYSEVIKIFLCFLFRTQPIQVNPPIQVSIVLKSSGSKSHHSCSTVTVCLLTTREGKQIAAMCWPHIPLGVLPSVFVFTQSFRFPVHTSSKPLPSRTLKSWNRKKVHVCTALSFAKG